MRELLNRKKEPTWKESVQKISKQEDMKEEYDRKIMNHILKSIDGIEEIVNDIDTDVDIT